MRRLAHALTVPAVAVTLVLSARPLAAQSGVGQSFTVSAAPNTVLQQLTVGTTGVMGSGATAAEPFVAEIFALSGGTTLVGSSLFSQVLGTSFSGLTLTPNLALAPGGSYVVVVEGRTGSLGASLENDFYAGGQALDCVDGTCSSLSFAGRDTDLRGFAVTFGPAVSAVPEPGTWPLLVPGLLGVAAVARRRRRTG